MDETLRPGDESVQEQLDGIATAIARGQPEGIYCFRPFIRARAADWLRQYPDCTPHQQEVEDGGE